MFHVQGTMTLLNLFLRPQSQLLALLLYVMFGSFLTMGLIILVILSLTRVCIILWVTYLIHFIYLKGP